MKTFKEFISEEGYDHLRDRGMLRPSKDKKAATTMPPSPEMKKTQKIYKGPSALGGYEVASFLSLDGLPLP